MLSSVNRIIARILAAFRSGDLDRQLQEELQFHLRLRTEDLVRHGMRPEQAERTARIELGGTTQIREAHRAVRAVPLLDAVLQDLRYIFRILAKTPGFTALAIGTLALGIGINTVVFTTYAAIAFRQLAARNPGEIVRLQWRTATAKSDQFSWAEYERISKSAELLAPVFATSTSQAAICNIPAPVTAGAEMVQLQFVSPNYFEALGIQPEIGRPFQDGDDAVVIVSHDFWVNKLGSDPELYGKVLSFQGGLLSIVGVAPQRFSGTGMPPQTPDLWIPASAQTLVMPGVDWIHDSGIREWQVLAREQPAKRSQGTAELAVLSKWWPKEAGEPVRLSAVPAMFFQTNGGGFETLFAEVSAILMAAVGLVLLIGCLNLTHLIAARNLGREQEIAVRLALGATRSRLVRQLCAESLVLGVMGGAVGILLSYWTCNWLGVESTELIRQVTNGVVGATIDMSPDWRVFVWTLGVSVATGIGIGILPAIRASNRDVNSTLKQGTAGALGHPNTQVNRNFMLAVQVASCLMLLAGAGLLFRGAARSREINAGFDYKHLAVVGINTHGIASSAAARSNVLSEAIQRMRALPPVVSVSWADRVPFLGTGAGTFRNDQGASLDCVFNGVSDEYFATVGIRLLTGRIFTRDDINTEPPIAVVSEATAKRLWPGQDPLGRRITPANTWLRDAVGHDSFIVVGVVKSVRSTWLSKDEAGYVYLPKRMHDGATLFLVRTRTLPDKSFKALSAAIARVNPNLPARTFVSSIEAGPVRIQELMAQAPAAIASIIGGLGLLLACIGIYGVVSRFVVRRTREIGIRMALGATTWDLIAAVSTQTLRPVAWGASAGLLGALVISGLLRALVVMPDVPDLTYGAGAFDPLTFVCVLALLAAVVIVAAFAPVWRATRVDPALALRNE